MNVMVPMSHRNMADQALSAGAPAIGRTILVLTAVSPINMRRGVKQPLLAHPTSPHPSHVVSLALRGYEAFF
jgi:hypothetical protein